MRLHLLNLAFLSLASLLVWGCGKANDSAVTVDLSGKHQSGWIASHGTAYLQDTTTCMGCHGATLVGGISGISCSSASLNGLSCHANGPHPLVWPEHNAALNQLNNCSPCHGVLLAGGKIAPACAKCHVQLLPGSVPVLGTCVSCHGNPPNGTAFPNISAAHKAHTLLALPCTTCHSGGGSGAAAHGNALTIGFPPAYSATTGTAVMNPNGNCSNVSCHGGITTPLWRGGRIDPLTECSVCHQAGTAAGVPQANSYYSGEHTLHLVVIGLICTDCHDMTVVSGSASHYSGLNTPSFELSPASTMRTPLNFSSGVRSCSPGVTPSAVSFSIGVCHTLRNW